MTLWKCTNWFQSEKHMYYIFPYLVILAEPSRSFSWDPLCISDPGASLSTLIGPNRAPSVGLPAGLVSYAPTCTMTVHQHHPRACDSPSAHDPYLILYCDWNINDRIIIMHIGLRCVGFKASFRHNYYPRLSVLTVDYRAVILVCDWWFLYSLVNFPGLRRVPAFAQSSERPSARESGTFEYSTAIGMLPDSIMIQSTSNQSFEKVSTCNTMSSIS